MAIYIWHCIHIDEDGKECPFKVSGDKFAHVIDIMKEHAKRHKVKRYQDIFKLMPHTMKAGA